MKRFPEDHAVEALRGFARQSNTHVRKRLAHRSAWLQDKVEARVRAGMPYDLYLEELAAIVQAVEAFDERCLQKHAARNIPTTQPNTALPNIPCHDCRSVAPCPAHPHKDDRR